MPIGSPVTSIWWRTASTLSTDLPELVVRSAVVSGRAAARDQFIGLTVVDGTVFSVRSDGRIETLCSGIRRAAWAPATALPREIGVVTSVGAVVLISDDSTNVFPLDVWWIEPAAPATPRQAVSSSGFDDLADRLGLEIAFDPDAMTGFQTANAVVHVPLPDTAARRARRRTFVVALLQAIALVPVPIAFALLGRGWGGSVAVLGWLSAAVSAAALVNVVLSVRGRRRTRLRIGTTVVRPRSGPGWFRERAGISVASGMVVIDDGRGRSVLLSTPQATSSASAVVRARTVRGKQARAVLIDGTDVVRAELPFAFWPESDIDELLRDLSVIRDAGSDRRRSADVRFDPHRGAAVPGTSLIAWTSLGVVPLIAVGGATILQLMVSVFAKIGGPLTWGIALSFGSASVVILLAVIGSELGGRLPPVEPPPRGFRPSRTFGSVVGWFVLLSAVAVGLLAVGDPGTACYAEALAFASVALHWSLYRRRAVQSRRGVTSIGRWLATGCRN